MSATGFSTVSLERLATADLLLLLSAFFKDPAALKPRLARESLDLDGLIQAAGWPPSTATALADLTGQIKDLEPERWTSEYNRLFQAGVACPPYETTYIRRDKGGIMADVQGFYTAFGLRPSSKGAERPDHVSCELDFLALVLVMAETARQKGEEERAAIAWDAARAFARDHLSEWIPAFCASLHATAGEPAFATLALALQDIWCQTARSFGLDSPVAAAPADRSMEDDAPDCSGCPID